MTQSARFKSVFFLNDTWDKRANPRLGQKRCSQVFGDTLETNVHAQDFVVLHHHATRDDKQCTRDGRHAWDKRADQDLLGVEVEPKLEVNWRSSGQVGGGATRSEFDVQVEATLEVGRGRVTKSEVVRHARSLMSRSRRSWRLVEVE